MRITHQYGPQMEALLIDPETKDLNNNGTVMVAIAGG